MLRDFVLGSNQTGLVTNTSGVVSVVGGEQSALANEVMTGQAEIFYGSGVTQSTYVYPSATVAAWNSFMATAATSYASPSATQSNGAIGDGSAQWVLPFAVLLVVVAV